jgi:hypothetical protein
MRTLVAALVLSTASRRRRAGVGGAAPGFGGRDVPGTLQNPYIVYDHGFPTVQLNTPQMANRPRINRCS